jgi:hypothetical protein
MRVIDFEGVHEAASVEELDTILNRKHGGGLNSFWLSQGSNTYPTLSLLVKGDLATINYIPKEHDAGFRSVGNVRGLNLEGTTTFAMSNDRADDVVVLNDAVLSFAAALKAAKEFFSSKDLPRSVQWMQL